MLIIPLEKSIDWRKPPFITFLLIIINSIILVYSHGYDKGIFENSLKYYVFSELPKIELPRYLDTQANFSGTLSNKELIANIENDNANEEVLAYILMEMENDVGFMEKLHQNRIINPQNAAYAQWQAARTKFESIASSSIASRYGFTPSKHKPITFLTHQFLHGGYDHLLGNMLFLFLIGFALETALGSLLYVTCYLLSGLGAVTLYWLIYPASDTVLVGASGAIAGLMGMYAGVFGLRKIRFFYSLLFYFDYIKAPALIMLPLWVANEIYQLYFTEGSNVAYMAHVGGLITGGIISFAIKRYFTKKVDIHYLDESAQKDEKNKLYEHGMGLLRELKIPQSKAIFSGLHARYPEDGDILIQYYKTLKYTPEADEYHAIVAKIFEKSHKYNASQILAIFKDYCKVHKIAQIPSRLLIKLALLFSKNDHQVDAEAILLGLLQKSSNIEGLDHALFALATAWQRLGNSGKHVMCLKLLAEHYPSQSVGINASRLLETL
jgi:membrane associated rhomboid family serine protease